MDHAKDVILFLFIFPSWKPALRAKDYNFYHYILSLLDNSPALSLFTNLLMELFTVAALNQKQSNPYKLKHQHLRPV